MTHECFWDGMGVWGYGGLNKPGAHCAKRLFG